VPRGPVHAAPACTTVDPQRVASRCRLLRPTTARLGPPVACGAEGNRILPRYHGRQQVRRWPGVGRPGGGRALRPRAPGQPSRARASGKAPLPGLLQWIQDPHYPPCCRPSPSQLAQRRAAAAAEIERLRVRRHPRLFPGLLKALCCHTSKFAGTWLHETLACSRHWFAGVFQLSSTLRLLHANHPLPAAPAQPRGHRPRAARQQRQRREQPQPGVARSRRRSRCSSGEGRGCRLATTIGSSICTGSRKSRRRWQGIVVSGPSAGSSRSSRSSRSAGARRCRGRRGVALSWATASGSGEGGAGAGAWAKRGSGMRTSNCQRARGRSSAAVCRACTVAPLQGNAHPLPPFTLKPGPGCGNLTRRPYPCPCGVALLRPGRRAA
jgi:hypothetical protein